MTVAALVAWLLILLLVATLGVFMFTRWIPIHRMASARH